MRESVIKAVASLGQLNIAGKDMPFPVDQKDLDAWKDVSPDGKLFKGDGGSLRAALRLLRDHREMLDGFMWRSGVMVDLDQVDCLLTAGAGQAYRKPAWLRLRLGVLLATQRQRENPEVRLLQEQLNLDPSILVALRDAAILRCFGFDAGAPGVDRDGMVAQMMSTLDVPMPGDCRELLRSSPEVREALKSVHVEPEDILALDAVFALAATAASGGDDRTSAVADLLAQSFANGEPLEAVFPEMDAAALKQELASGETAMLARLADGKRLAERILLSMYRCDSLGACGKSWAESAEKRFWIPFRDAALRGNINWIADALSLLASAHAIACRGQQMSRLVGRYESALGLDEARLGLLVKATLSLDAGQFHLAVCADRAADVAAGILSDPLDGTADLTILGLSDVDSLRQRLIQRIESKRSAAPCDSAAGKTFHELATLAVAKGQDDGGRLLDALARHPGMGLDREMIIRYFVLAGADLAASVRNGKMLEFCRANQGWLVEYVPDIQARIDLLMRAQYDDLLAKMGGPDACSSRCGLSIIWRLLCGQTQPAELAREYQVDPAGLARLEKDFYEGRLDSLRAECEHRLLPPLVHWRKPDRSMLQTVCSSATVRIFGGLLAFLLVGSLAVHLALSGGPQVETIQREGIAADDPSEKSVLTATKVASLAGTGRKTYARSVPVTYQEYVALMGEPVQESMRQVGSASERPVCIAGYGEAAAFCKSLTEMMRAKYPGAWSGQGTLKGYAFRLPTAAEAKASPAVVEDSPADAEWVLCDDQGKAAIGAVLGRKPAMLFKPAGAQTELRSHSLQRTTFRVVLAAEGQ